LLWAVVLFIAVTVVTYIIFFIIPADPARAVAGKNPTPEMILRARHYLGIDKPVYIQYQRFHDRHDIHQDHGRSIANRESDNTEDGKAAPVTASLVFGGMIVWLLIAFPVGVYSALRPRSKTDRAAMVGVLIGISAHPVWIGLLLSYFFGYRWQVTPIQGYCEVFSPPPGQSQCAGFPIWQWAYHLILPWITIAVLYAAFYVRMIRSNTMETLNEDYVRTARAKGVRESTVLRSHVLRNAILPVVTMLGMDLALALGGAIFTEYVFGLPGLGKEAVDSIRRFDYPTTVGITVFATVVVITFNLLVDILYAYIDPRIRLS
jgi:peptide/nickel transport system permease protein